MLRDWPLLAGCIGAALVPYLIERLAFKERFGIFALLFWLLVLQFLAIYLSVGPARFLEDNGWVFLAGLLKGIGAMAFMTIGVIPLIALPLSISIALAVLAFRLFRQVR
ncbi:MAG: hypothetical protein EOS58_10475 [Mesorhizobium sp.]|uniref:hypothetical protein n=1 Tax=unclassified Mesorhizobium TaxID=325217 RepID=UPI000F763294|nr:MULTISPECIES: hypothetical protein [unclassified Mesorhizobium]AZO49424.1 hypothetical protein EJ073_17690 [Mesorhizobium sp. M4B.F.Ca.ET.058.02.1.1]RVC40336.1 hypothetical protein EN781_29975 [Mesorhizobium sp. M4A.F.Ca.ET.090.04.2.1]RVC83387.1 hypothetical protein EN745_03015 [Mesorhizobium sp. M4A.F.Ca.ET.022.05.2.1]RWC53863.1 MAG: hypothetical protein EOS54_11830 [Mesorhizobium sp.]RWD05099.1 MAG: hypothetical protein EOS58_10475 [Mesorhizobium sp.]